MARESMGWQRHRLADLQVLHGQQDGDSAAAMWADTAGLCLQRQQGQRATRHGRRRSWKHGQGAATAEVAA
jgi:hypothetical protein